ncbi:MAG: peptidylprolyl isomerase [Actinomycetota bacterium]
MRARPLLALGLAASLLAACGPPGSVAAEVAGREISVASLERSALLYTLLGELNGQGCGAPEGRETYATACDRFTLSNLIQEAIVDRYAVANDVTVPEGAAESAVADLEESLGEGILAERLARSGLAREEFVGLAERLLLFNEVRDDLAASISDDDLRAAYDASTDYTTIDTKHILVADEATAAEVAAQATPENFGDLAREYSVDTASAERGGALGPIAASSLDADYVAGALALEPGQISAPVQSQFGWHVILLVAVDRTPFARAADQLRLQLSSQAYATWLQGEYADLEIVVNPRFGRIDLSTGEVRPVSSTASEDATTP